MEDYVRAGFKLNSVVRATVRCIKDDRVRFSVINSDGEEYVDASGNPCTAWYYIHGEGINTHQVFKKNDVIEVKVLSILRDSIKHPETIILVKPEFLPVDYYLQSKPIGSIVEGKIIKVEKSGMTIELQKVGRLWGVFLALL